MDGCVLGCLDCRCAKQSEKDLSLSARSFGNTCIEAPHRKIMPTFLLPRNECAHYSSTHVWIQLAGVMPDAIRTSRTRGWRGRRAPYCIIMRLKATDVDGGWVCHLSCHITLSFIYGVKLNLFLIAYRPLAARDDEVFSDEKSSKGLDRRTSRLRIIFYRWGRITWRSGSVPTQILFFYIEKIAK